MTRFHNFLKFYWQSGPDEKYFDKEDFDRVFGTCNFYCGYKLGNAFHHMFISDQQVSYTVTANNSEAPPRPEYLLFNRIEFK